MIEDWAKLVSMAERVGAGETFVDPDLSFFGGDTFEHSAVGLAIDEIAWDRLSAHVDAGPQHWQALGIVNGGVWCTVVESLASLGAAIRAVIAGRQVVGVSNTTEFLRSHSHGRVDAVARPVDAGELHQLWEVSINRSSDGQPVANGQVRLQMLDFRAAAPS
jgi:1,4-dihydroxy-2-naphthoyl-CoA hydrolase